MLLRTLASVYELAQEGEWPKTRLVLTKIAVIPGKSSSVGMEAEAVGIQYRADVVQFTRSGIHLYNYKGVTGELGPLITCTARLQF